MVETSKMHEVVLVTLVVLCVPLVARGQVCEDDDGCRQMPNVMAGTL